jgi:hypothetical protein
MTFTTPLAIVYVGEGAVPYVNMPNIGLTAPSLENAAISELTGGSDIGHPSTIEVQLLFEHTSPDGQGRPQPPQALLFEVMSMQIPSQSS